MLNKLLKMITGKEIILYDKHRQTEPLAKNPVNKKSYYFFEVSLIWKYIPFKTTDKRKHKIMYFILNCIQPKYILSMNWISKRESLYMVWTANHPKSKFIVIQHGAYVGGIVTDVPHKYTKCDVFLTWGFFFVEEFKKHNCLKKVKVINFGNSVYNEFDRANYQYKENRSNKVLFTPTALDEKNIQILYTLINTLNSLDFEVSVRPHAFQGRTAVGIEFPQFQGVTLVNEQLYDVLQNNDYDFVIADHSSSLLDAIFFKNKVLYFDPLNKTKGYTTNYSNYLTNVYDEDLENCTKEQFLRLVNIESQEALLANMITLGNNQLDNLYKTKEHR